MLDAEFTDDLVEHVEVKFLHGKTCAQHVNDRFAGFLREVDGRPRLEAFGRKKHYRIFFAVTDNPERFELGKREEMVVDMDAFAAKRVVNNPRWAMGVDEKRSCHNRHENTEGNRPYKEEIEHQKGDDYESKYDEPQEAFFVVDIFVGLPTYGLLQGRCRLLGNRHGGLRLLDSRSGRRGRSFRLGNGRGRRFGS